MKAPNGFRSTPRESNDCPMSEIWNPIQLVITAIEVTGAAVESTM